MRPSRRRCPAGFQRGLTSGPARGVSSRRHASGPDHPLGPLGMAKIECKDDSWRKPAQSRPRLLIDRRERMGESAWSKRNGLSVRGACRGRSGSGSAPAVGAPDCSNSFIWKMVPIISSGGAWPVSTVSGSWDCGRLAGLNLGAVGAYSTDGRAATNFHGAQKSRNRLGDRYSMARRRNGSNQGIYYGT